MTTKKNSTSGKEERQGKVKVKVGKLQLNKETLKDLTVGAQKQVRGGVKACSMNTTTCPPC